MNTAEIKIMVAWNTGYLTDTYTVSSNNLKEIVKVLKAGNDPFIEITPLAQDGSSTNSKVVISVNNIVSIKIKDLRNEVAGFDSSKILSESYIK